VKIEIEAKMPLRDREATVRRLTDLHAEPVARMIEENIFVDCEEHRLHTSDRGLRIRGIREPDQSPRYTVTYKGPRRHGRLKNRREVEFQVDSPESALELLAELGYHETVRFEAPAGAVEQVDQGRTVAVPFAHGGFGEDLRAERLEPLAH